MDAVRVVHRLHHIVNGDAEILQLPDDPVALLTYTGDPRVRGIVP